MGIKHFFDQEVIVKRLRTLSGDKIGMSTTATVDGHIQEADTEARQRLGIIEGRAWKAWFSLEVDIKEGDKLTDSKGIEYVVHEITKKDYAFGINQHLTAILKEHND